MKKLSYPVTLYYSYAPEDEKLQKRLEKHLGLLRQQGIIAEWHRRRLEPGVNWIEAIDYRINAASVILLLISSDYLASEYCYGTEMQRALKRYEDEEVDVIPILLRPVDWQMSPFAHLQCLPRNTRPVTSWENRDEAFLDIARSIRSLVQYKPGSSEEETFSSPSRPSRASIPVFAASITAFEKNGKKVDYKRLPSGTSDEQSSGSRSRKLTERVSYESPDGIFHSQWGSSVLTYCSDRIGRKIWIKPDLTYLPILANGELFVEYSSGEQLFSEYQLPQLSAKIVNNSRQTLLLSEVVIQVHSSVINREPLLRFIGSFRETEEDEEQDQEMQSESLSGGPTLYIWNDGWGEVLDPVLLFGIVSEYQTVKVSSDPHALDSLMIHTLQLENFVQEIHIPIRNYLPQEKPMDPVVYMFGRLHYTTETHQKRAVNFETVVPLGHRSLSAPLLPSYLYDVLLKAGRSGYTRNLPIYQQIKPRESDHFLIQIASDKSARFDLTFSFRAVGGVEISSDEVILDFFTPRSIQNSFFARGISRSFLW